MQVHESAVAVNGELSDEPQGKKKRQRANDFFDSALTAPFAPRLAELSRHAADNCASWAEVLDLARRAAVQTDDELHEEGRRQARRLYGDAYSAHFWPEAPSIAVLIDVSVRTEAETAFATEIEAFCASVAEAKAGQLERLQSAKAASPPQIERVRELGRELGSLATMLNSARSLDKPVRERLQVATLRIARYRGTRAVRPVSPGAHLVGVPPTRAGYQQILDFYRLTDAATLSFGRTLDGPQFFTDIRRNVAILHATCGEAGKRHGGLLDGNGSDALAQRDGDSGEGLGRVVVCGQRDAVSKTGSGSADSRGVLFCEYAVSGIDAPGLNPPIPAEGQPPRGPFLAIECVDGLGESYKRDHDAEFKLVSELCAAHLGLHAPGQVNESYTGRLTLWSKKPLCASCFDVVHCQLAAALPSASVEVRIDDADF